MTITNYKFHKNNMERSTKDSKESFSVVRFIPEELDKLLLKSCDFPKVSNNGMLKKLIEDEYVEQENGPENAPEKLPSSNIDSRSLIENQIVTELTKEDQFEIRKHLHVMILEAILETKQVQYDRKKSIYNQGVQEALFTAKEDLENETCLYALMEKYLKIANVFMKIIENETDSSDLDYPQTRHKGTASAYINLVNIFKDKLSNEETSGHRIVNLQPIR